MTASTKLNPHGLTAIKAKATEPPKRLDGDFADKLRSASEKPTDPTDTDKPADPARKSKKAAKAQSPNKSDAQPTDDQPEEPAAAASNESSGATVAVQLPVGEAAAADDPAKEKPEPAKADSSELPTPTVVVPPPVTKSADPLPGQVGTTDTVQQAETGGDAETEQTDGTAQPAGTSTKPATAAKPSKLPGKKSADRSKTVDEPEPAKAAKSNQPTVTPQLLGVDTEAAKVEAEVDASPAVKADAPSAPALPDPTPATPRPAAAAGDKPKAEFVVPTPAQFAEENHPKIVTGVHGQLLPNGGTMQISLNPPDLGAMQVTVSMKDGVLSAAFETANDDATSLLSHSLGQLKSALEATGVGVDKLRVEQNTKQDAQSNDRDGSSTPQEDQQQNRRNQQRQELIRRMWRKMRGGDPLDLVA